MQKKCSLLNNRFVQVGFLSLVFFSCVFKSSSSDENKTPLWNESKDLQTVSVITPDVYVKIRERFDDAVVNISTVEKIKAPKRQMPMDPGGQGQNPFPSPGQGPSPFDDLFKDFFDRFQPREGMKRQSLGSGFIIHQDGYIVTNNHVVEGADEIKVLLKDDASFTAKVIGRDPKTDIALIKIDIDKKTQLKTVLIGDSDKMRVGDMVVAIGNPFGLDHTMTTGIISAKGRSIQLGNYDDFLQTDASINPGNSGGPLLNIKGEVIGINTAINASGQGIGFAIPINMAKDILPQLRNKGKVTRGWLGVYISRVDADLAKVLGMEKSTGAVVIEIQNGSPADKVQIQKGDVILSFNGKKVSDYNDLPKMVAITPPNTKVTLEILRDKNKLTKTLTIGELPDEEAIAANEAVDKTNKLGIDVQDITPEMANSMGLEKNEKGVVVNNVDPDSMAFDKGLRRGDLIQEINRSSIKSKSDFDTAIQSIRA
jgi:serine protease Do